MVDSFRNQQFLAVRYPFNIETFTLGELSISICKSRLMHSTLMMHCETVFQSNTFLPARRLWRLAGPKIVLDHVHIYVYILYIYVCTTILKYTLYWKYMNWGCTTNQNTCCSWSMQTHEYHNMNKLYIVPDTACNSNVNWGCTSYI